VYNCVCVFLHIQSPLRECRSIRSGAFGLPYYCAPLVCISVVIGLLAVWRHNKPKTKNRLIKQSKTKLHETGDWDIFLGPPERARAETGGADQWVLKRRELPGFAILNRKKRPHPWDTHHQFSIKTLLSKQHYMCVRLPLISWSIAGVPSSRALPGYPITAPPTVCAFLM